MLCWKCKNPCRVWSVSGSAIRPPPEADYFAVFGLQKRYFIDSEDVRSAHLRRRDFTSGQVAPHLR